jgi:NAD+ kinase
MPGFKPLETGTRTQGPERTLKTKGVEKLILAIVYDHKKPQAVALAHEVRARLEKLGHKAYFGLNRQNLSKVRMAITMGGDGLIMNVANRVVAYRIPLLRINFGRVGFMADIEPEEAWTKIEDAVERENYIIIRKTRLEVLYGNAQSASWQDFQRAEALNDIIIERTDTKVITLAVDIEAEHFELRGDGSIFFTENGSTAYNVSAGGRPLFKEYHLGVKVISPTAGALPDHLVRSDQDIFLIRLLSGKARLVADDKRLADMEGQLVVVRKSARSTYFAVVGDIPRLED